MSSAELLAMGLWGIEDEEFDDDLFDGSAGGV